MAKDSLARGARSASFGHSAKKDEPIEFHGTVAVPMVVDEELIKVVNEISDREARKLPPDDTIRVTQEMYEQSRKLYYGTPLNDWVLIRRAEKKSDDLIVQPDAYQQKSNIGEVLAVAQNAPLEPGNTVLFGEYNAEDITLHGEKLALVDFHDIRLVLPR